MKLLTDAQLEAVQKYAKLGMQTSVRIYRRSVTVGLETTDDPYGSSVEHEDEVTEVGGVLGWLHSAPTPVQVMDTGAVITINTYRLYLPVETNILPGDHAVIGSNTYVVGDTNADETWPALLNCSLRLRE